MTASITVECQVHLRREGPVARKQLQGGKAPTTIQNERGRIPRVARLMALAIQLDEQIRQGLLTSYSEVAELGHVTPARVSQIMSLLHLAPDIQEALLFWPKTKRGRDPIHLRDLLPIAAILDWRKQRRLWQNSMLLVEKYHRKADC